DVQQSLPTRRSFDLSARQKRVAVAADDHVNAVHGRGDLLVARIADMREEDDLVDALALDFGNRPLEIGDLVLEADRVARRGGFRSEEHTSELHSREK